MRHGQPSLTAVIVAGARAAAHVDPIAERLVPGHAGALLRAVARVTQSDAGSRVVRALSLGLVDHLDLRTRAIDDVVARAGSAQVVILGAGLDARGFRMPELAASVVFEVDHPATQSFKRARVEGAHAFAREVRFVGVDFERDELGAELGRAGHLTTAPTTWIWEGVTPYLTKDAIVATLDVVAARSAPASTLVMTYGTRELGTLPRVLRRFVTPAFRVLGEELRGLMSSGAAAELVSARGFEITSDDAVADLHARFGVAREPRRVVAERLLVARHA